MPKAGVAKKKPAAKKPHSVKGEPLTATMRSSHLVLRKPIITLHGTVGSGKSTMAASVSKYYPKTRPTKKFRGKAKDRLYLKDVWVLAFDNGAFDCIYDLGFDADVFDVNLFMAEEDLWSKIGKFQEPPDIIQVIDFAIDEAVKQVYKHGKKWIIVDGPSMLDRKLNHFWKENCPVNRKGVEDTRAMYGELLISHMKLTQELLIINAGVVYCCHSKAYSDDLSADQKKAKTTTVVAGMPDVVPDITGKGALLYKADASLELYMHATPAAGNKGMIHKAYAIASEDMANREVKNRFGLSLDPVEEPHLGKILKKIKGEN